MDAIAPTYDWQQLLARCEQWGRARAEWERSKGHELTADQLPSARAPATEVQIAREEARLGVRLPPSLRSFYLQSNGHGVVTSFVYAVRSVEQIGWMRDVEPDLYKVNLEFDPAVARCLVVSGEADASWWLLDPEQVDGRGEWRTGRWSSWNPGMRWIAADFFGLFEQEVASSEQLLQREKVPPPPPGTGRPRNALSVGAIDSGSPVVGGAPAPNGYAYVPAEGFASVVTISAPSSARVGEWIALTATRSSGPWNLVQQAEIGPDEICLLEPLIFEPDVAANLAWIVDPPGISMFDTGEIAGADRSARGVMFAEPGVYKLRGHSSFPLKVFSNEITIKVV
ncbi:MAG TPA: SMI1/KNR4 family protein [Steroidobacteraceae bacterium]|nr:SMI1/KNR4 family protein [Steroidobacteraceae bacterium]